MRNAARIIRGVLARAAVIAAVAGTLVGIAGAGQALASPTDQSGAYQLDTAHDGYIADAGLAAPLTQAWSITLPAATSYPLIVNGVVYVTAANDTLYALNQATGSTLWSHALGGIYFWSGLTYDRGRVFVVNTSGLLMAFDAATGSVAWSKQMPGQYLFSSPPTAANGIVYTGGAGSGGTVYAVRERDGTLLWAEAVENGDHSSPAVDGQGVYVSYACQQAYGFDPLDGTLLWHHDSACEGGGGKTPVLANGTIFARDLPLGNVMLSASTGEELGAFNAGPAPAVANDVAFMLSGSTLTAVADAGQGANSWQFNGDSNLDTAPLVVGGLVFIGSSQGNLYALDAATGSTSWSTNVGAAIPAPDEQNVSQPLTGLGAANGTLIVPVGDQLTAYRTAGSIATAPSNDSSPTIDGTPQQGQLLAADVGIWSGLPSSYAYQWELCDSGGANCADIGGATDATYTPAGGDIGSTLRVKVGATNGNGSSSMVESAASAVVAGGPPANQTLPTIAGDAEQDGFLSADPGTWSGDPTDFSYQWRRCNPGTPPLSCSDIADATGDVYFPTQDDVGYQIVVDVTATNAGGDSDPAESDPTDVVVGGWPENLSFPTVSGIAEEGQTLVADRGEWSGNPTDYSYQWFSCSPDFSDGCPDIAGATDQAYNIQPADLNRWIGVEVVATNDNGDSAPADSDVVGPVQESPPASLKPPTIPATVHAGQTLSVGDGTWSGSPTSFSYQWYTCDTGLGTCNPIPTATGMSYHVSPGDLGRRLIVGVVASNDSGDSDEELSNPTDPVLPAPPSLEAAPTISGTARVGGTLSADSGTWSNNPSGYRYQWKRCDSTGTNCTGLADAGGVTYAPAGADVGKRLVVEVVALNAGGSSAPADSSASAVVASQPRCHVPKVVGMKLAAAKTKIRDRQCRVGHIARKTSSAAKKGRILSQSPKPGRTETNRGKVNLTVGKG